MTRPIVQSPIVEIMAALGPHAEQVLAGLSDLELAALWTQWTEAWARPKQVVPQGDWTIYAFVQARGTGKTEAVARFVHSEVMAARARELLLCAQTAPDTVRVCVGAILRVAPPWERPELKTVEKDLYLIWPNGTRAAIKSAEVVEKRGPEYDLAWCAELVAWKRSKRMAVWDNIQLSVRIGYAKTIVDTTPKKGHPVIKEIKAEAEVDPTTIWVHDSIEANEINLAPGKVAKLRRRYKNKPNRSKEELDGTEADEGGGLVDDDWIEGHRRNLPTVWKRRIVSVDPAVSDAQPGYHNSGVVALGLGIDDQMYVTQDETAVLDPAAWANKAIDIYIQDHCDCMLIEKNKGGNVLDALVSLLAEKRGWQIAVVELTAKTRYTHGTINIKLVYSRGDKEQRADVLVEAYKSGRVSHVLSADLEDLETTLTTWEQETASGRDSPGDLDSTTMGVTELQDLWELQPKPTKGHDKLNEAARQRHQRDQAQRQRQRRVGRPASSGDPGIRPS